MKAYGIDNGEAYSDWDVYGFIIVDDDLDESVLWAAAKDADSEVCRLRDELFKEWNEWDKSPHKKKDNEPKIPYREDMYLEQYKLALTRRGVQYQLFDDIKYISIT